MQLKFVVKAVQFVAMILAVMPSSGLGYPRGQNQDPPASRSDTDDSDMYLEPQEQESRLDDVSGGQASHHSFYPSFSPFQDPPLGHSRPFYFQQEGAYSHRPGGFPQQQVSYDSPRYSGYKDDSYRAAANAESQGILGSGNFGVIRGGTFYDSDTSESKQYDKDYSSYFGNSHGGPFYYGSGSATSGVPNPRPYQHEQFENFRDFADINSPTNSAYSQYVVVYANKNTTTQTEEPKASNHRPKNIIESLALLDLESTTLTNQEAPQKKPSRSKAKLAKSPPEKKIKIKIKTKQQLSEPLLALS